MDMLVCVYMFFVCNVFVYIDVFNSFFFHLLRQIVVWKNA